MMFDDRCAGRAALALFAAGAAWPSVYGALTQLAISPLEHTLGASWCGAAPHVAYEFLGHCPQCWAGAATLLLAGLITLSASPRLRRQGAA
jgi:hypothetical protein